jgi:hypothetical protein
MEKVLESPSNLISVNRLDVFSKTPLVYAWANGLNDAWGQELYKTYMLATRPPQGFSEDNLKYSLDDYIKSFRSLFESIKLCGFDPKYGSIPSTEMGITNGAHRLASALVLGENVVRENSTEENHNYGFRFMQSVGIPEKFIDAIILEYLEYAQRSTVYCAMGITSSIAANIQKSLNQSGFSTVYVKAIKLSEIGKRRLMKVLYGANDWWTTDFYEYLALERFSNRDSTYFFFVVSKSSGEEILFKSEIRDKYFDHFTFKKFHSSDNNKETLRIAESVLNENSLFVLNEAPIESERRLIELIKGHQYLQNLDRKSFAIDGSANLEILGIRKAKDLDFIEIETNNSEVLPSSMSHNLEYRLLPIEPSQLIIDPRNFAVIEGYKFVSIAQTISFKAHRAEPKDLLDIANLCERNISGSIYGDDKTRRALVYLRFKVVLRKRVNRVLAPLPTWFQRLIRHSYIQLRKFFKRLTSHHNH